MDANTILSTAVSSIRMAPGPQARWSAFCDAIERLESLGTPAASGLIAALGQPNQSIRLLAMLYLGMLQDERGVMSPSMVSTATSAIVNSALGPKGGEIEPIAANTALALLGDSDAIRNTRHQMQQFGVHDEREFHAKSMHTVVDHIAQH